MKTKLKLVTPKTYQNKPNGYSITLEDGTVGNLAEKDSDKDLKVGEEVECTVSDYLSKKGNHSNLFTIKRVELIPPAPPPLPLKPLIHVGTGKNREELKAEASMRIAEKCLDAFFADKLDDGQVKDRHHEYSRLLWSDIDEIFDNSKK